MGPFGSKIGNSAMEYALVGVVLASVMIPTLTELSGGLNSVFMKVVNEYEPSAGSEGVIGATLSSKSGGLTVASIPGSAGASAPELIMPNGTVIHLPMAPQDMSQIVETVGVNGTTTALAESLKVMAEQLMAAGEITREQGNQLIQLANQGYRMGEIQAILEQASDSANGDILKYLMTPVFFEGQSYHPFELSMTLGFFFSSPQDYGVSADAASSNFLNQISAASESVTFMQLYESAKQSGALSNPNVYATVDYLAGNIMSLSDSLQDTVLGGEFLTLREGVVSRLTDQSSSGICATGNGTTQNDQCGTG